MSRSANQLVSDQSSAIPKAELAVSSPADPVTDPTEKDLQQLQGTWEQTVPNFAQGTSMTIAGKMKSVRANEEVIVNNITLEIDATTNPKTWDERPGDHPDLVFRGGYMMEGDVLTRCFAPPNEPRPTGFRSEQNPDVAGATAVFRRVK